MRLLVVFLAFLSISGVIGDPQKHRLFQANVDKYVDILLGYVQKWIIDQGMDPFKLDDIVRTFKAVSICIRFKYHF